MIKVTDRRLMRKGDKGAILFNVDLKDFHFSEGQHYPMVITAIHHGVEFDVVNNIGQTQSMTHDRNDERDGYEAIYAEVEEAVFDARVEELHAEVYRGMIEEHQRDIKQWRDYCDQLKINACNLSE